MHGGGPALLEAGARFRLDLADQPGDATRAPLPHPEVFEALRPGTTVLLDDGRIRLEVESSGSDHAECVVRIGGPLTDHKGVKRWQYALGRSPRAEELHLALAHLRAQRGHFSGIQQENGQSGRFPITSLCHVLLNSNEFLYVD